MISFHEYARMIVLAGLWAGWVALGSGCATTRQSAADLDAALAWFVPESNRTWPGAAEETMAFERPPAVAVAWVPQENDATRPRATKSAREGWIAAIQEKLARSNRVASAVGTPPDLFDDGVTIEGLQALARDRKVDVVVLFGFEVTRRRYHAFEPVSSGLGGQASVDNVLEVVTIGRAVGVTATGRPIFADMQNGFASADPRARSLEELEAISERVAADSLAEAIVVRLDRLGASR